MAELFQGQFKAPFPNGKLIVTNVESIACAAGDVDIAFHSCQIQFGKKTITLSGRAAHEFFATLVEAGVSSDGSAGKQHENVSNLKCTVDPNAIKHPSGGGADCNFDAISPP
jgi:hypothetical protein